jgi:hypothetical protein
MQPAVSSEQFPWDTAESRPLVSSKSKEAGEDYWIDDKDLEKSIQRKQAIKNRKVRQGVSDVRLRRLERSQCSCFLSHH